MRYTSSCHLQCQPRDLVTTSDLVTMSAVVTSFPTVYNVRCPPPVIDCLVRNNASVLKLIRTPFYQRNRCPEYIYNIY